MTFRTIIAIASLAIGIGAVSAQQNPIEARKALMKANGQQAQIGSRMVKGEESFDLGKAKTIFATYQDSSVKVKDLFPPNSQTGGETAADPRIWQNMADFQAKLAKFGVDAKEASGKIKDLDSFRAAFADVMKNCGGCHETYRIKKS